MESVAVVVSHGTPLPLGALAGDLTPWVVMVVAPLCAIIWHLEPARAAVEAEIERTRLEREAFEDFGRHLRRASVGDQPAAPTGVPSIVRTWRPPERTDVVERAYRETVMTIPHYESEYGESAGEGIAHEFGPDFVIAAASGGTTPAMVEELVRRSREVVAYRTDLIARHRDEKADVEATERKLNRILDEVEAVENEVACPATRQHFGALEADWNQLERLECRCEGLLQDRQATNLESWLDEANNGASIFGAVHQYLYRDLAVEYPVLDATLSTIERIHEARSEVEAAILDIE